jgi:hypothetical protein
MFMDVLVNAMQFALNQHRRHNSLNVKGSGAAAVHDRIKAAMKNFAELINP